MSCTSDTCNNSVNINPVVVRKIVNPVTVQGGTSLSESGKLFSTSSYLKGGPNHLVYALVNPRNSGKTLKIQKIWISLFQGTTTTIYMLKDSIYLIF